MASSLHLADDTNPPTISSKTEVYDFLACDNNGPSLTGHGHDHDQETSDLELAPNICPSSTPPPDHGKAAWLFLAGCFLTEGLIWGIFTLTKKVSGLPFSYGIFEEYYSNHPPFSEHPHNLAAVGTTTTGVTYFISPFAVIALQRWPTRRLLMTVVGLALILIGLVSASFARHANDLVITQGAIYGFGGALLYNPFVFYLDEWFIARKGLAFGILWAGTGVGGAVVPLIMNWCLNQYGFRTTLRMWAVTIFILITPLIIKIKPRLPCPPSGSIQPLNLRFFRTPIFWILQVGNIIEGLGYFMPSIYLPSYASNFLHLSTLNSTLLISLLNLSSVAGTILIGFLTDHLHPTSVILFSSLGSAVAVFLIWGFALSEPVIYIFALFYGIFAGGYTAIWTGCVSEIQRDAIEAEAGVVIGMMAAGRGLGAVMSGPVSESLLGYGGWDGLGGAYGNKYGVLIVFTGVTAVFGAFGVSSRLRFLGVDDASIMSTIDIRMSHETVRGVDASTIINGSNCRPPAGQAE